MAGAYSPKGHDFSQGVDRYVTIVIWRREEWGVKREGGLENWAMVEVLS
jgi:hypothetical protein